MQTQRLVEGYEKLGWHEADASSHAFDGYRPHLFGLRLCVTVKTRLRGAEQDLEGVDARHVRGHGDHGDDPPPEASGRRVGSVVADDHGGPPLVGLGTAYGVEIDEADLASTDPVSAPLAVDSQASASSTDHSPHASSYAGPSSEARRSRTALCNTAEGEAMPGLSA